MPTTNIWNWQQPDWPRFSYDASQLTALEAEFLKRAGVFSGAIRHIGNVDQQRLTVELISDEAFYTSQIEGELLNRDSLQSSIRRQFGLATDHRKVPPAEQGVAQMTVDVYRQFDAHLSHEHLFHWHRLLMNGRRDLKDVGVYRTDKLPMQIVSGPVHEPKIHFEAPPSKAVAREMSRFVKWFAVTAPSGKTPLPILTRAGIAHLYFVSIHPFEDGNGRIGRAIAEKAISEGLGQPTLLALSQTINRERKAYYSMLERGSRGNEITPWLVWFAQILLDAQAHAQLMVDFIIGKAKFYDRLRGLLNERQEKVIARIMREGPDGFEGGLSAEKYIRLTGTSRATATRDLQDLVDKKALTRSGMLKSTRYKLNLTLPSS